MTPLSLWPRCQGGSSTTLQRYALAIGLAGLALLATLSLPPVGERVPLALSLAAVMLSAWAGGLGPGLFASLIGTLALDSVVLGVPDSPAQLLDHLIVLGVFVLVAFCIVGLTAARQQAQARAEAALEDLRRSEARFHRLAERAPDMIYRFNLQPAPRLTYVSPAAATITGFQPEELLADPDLFTARLHPEDRAPAAEALTSPSAACRLVVRWQHRDGHFVWLEHRLVPVHPENGALQAVEGIARDVTERQRAAEERAGLLAAAQAAQARAEAEARFHTLVEGAPDAVVVVDRQSRIVLVNAATEQLFGYPREELLGQDLGVLVPEGLRARHAALAERYFASPHHRPMGTNLIVQGRRSDGSAFSAECALTPLEMEDGPVVAATVRDITERLQVEQERRFLAESGSALASSLDYETILARVARLAVPALADACLVDLVDEAGAIRRLAEAHADAAAEPVLRMLREHPPRAGSRHPVPLALRTQEPQLCPSFDAATCLDIADDAAHLEVHRQLAFTSSLVVPLLARGQVLGALSLFSASVERRLGQSDLPLAQEAARRAALALDNARLYRQVQQSLQDRAEFVAAISHDLKNPITAAKGYAQMARRLTAGLGAPQTEPLAKSLSQVEAALGRMTTLIEDLLDVGRLEVGADLALHRQAIDLVSLAGQLVDAVNQRQPSVRLRLIAEVPSLEGWWDASRLERVLDNLLGNAVKYSLNRGEVRVRVGRAGDVAVLQISDRGIGIPAADLPHVFDRFHRAGNVAGRVAGTGLGLWGSRRIVEQHGGTIAIDSREGFGTRVIVRLPLDRPPR